MNSKKLLYQSLALTIWDGLSDTDKVYWEACAKKSWDVKSGSANHMLGAHYLATRHWMENHVAGDIDHLAKYDIEYHVSD